MKYSCFVLVIFLKLSGVEVARLEEPLILRMSPDILIASPVYLWTQMLTVTGTELSFS